MRTDTTVSFPARVAVCAEDAQRAGEVVGDDPLEEFESRTVLPAFASFRAISLDMINDEKLGDDFTAARARVAVPSEDLIAETAVVTCASGDVSRVVLFQPTVDSGLAAFKALAPAPLAALVTE